MKRKMTVLILGSNGLIGNELFSHLSKNRFIVWGADLNKSKERNQIQLDITKYKDLKKEILDLNPSLIINCVNLATIYSSDPSKNYSKLINFYTDLYRLLNSLPKATHYIQIGTTGSGGLGLNIPFTHGQRIEDLPIINKSAFAGISTAMLVLLSRSLPKGFKVSEMKPGLAIFSDQITVSNFNGENLITLNGGESGHYTYNELRLLTSFMGFTITKNITDKIIDIINAKFKTIDVQSHDVTAALNSTIVSESAKDRATYQKIIKQMRSAAKSCRIIATGNLGPPAITCDLLAAEIICQGHQCANKQQFAKIASSDLQYQATINYLKQTKPQLARYISQEANYQRYKNLLPTFNKNLEPWQLVVKRIKKIKVDGTGG